MPSNGKTASVCVRPHHIAQHAHTHTRERTICARSTGMRSVVTVPLIWNLIRWLKMDIETTQYIALRNRPPNSNKSNLNNTEIPWHGLEQGNVSKFFYLPHLAFLVLATLCWALCACTIYLQQFNQIMYTQNRLAKRASSMRINTTAARPSPNTINIRECGTRNRRANKSIDVLYMYQNLDKIQR